MLQCELNCVYLFGMIRSCNSHVTTESCCPNLLIRRPASYLFDENVDEALRRRMLITIGDTAMHYFSIEFHECPARKKLSVFPEHSFCDGEQCIF